MDKALKIGRLIAYAAELLMASLMAKDAFDNISERRAKEKVNNGKSAEEAVPKSNQPDVR